MMTKKITKNKCKQIKWWVGTFEYQLKLGVSRIGNLLGTGSKQGLVTII